MKIEDGLLNLITLLLGGFLVLMAAIPLLFTASACGTTSIGLCFPAWVGAAGSVVSGIGVFVLIYDIRKRLSSEAKGRSEKEIIQRSKQKDAHSAIGAIDQAFGSRAREILSAEEADRLSIACQRRGTNPIEQLKEEFSRLQAFASEGEMLEPSIVQNLRETIRSFHQEIQKSSWNDTTRAAAIREISDRSTDALRLIDEIKKATA